MCTEHLGQRLCTKGAYSLQMSIFSLKYSEKKGGELEPFCVISFTLINIVTPAANNIQFYSVSDTHTDTHRHTDTHTHTLASLEGDSQHVLGPVCSRYLTSIHAGLVCAF